MVLQASDQHCLLQAGDQHCQDTFSVLQAGDQHCLLQAGDQHCLLQAGDQHCLLQAGDQHCQDTIDFYRQTCQNCDLSLAWIAFLYWWLLILVISLYVSVKRMLHKSDMGFFC